MTDTSGNAAVKSGNVKNLPNDNQSGLKVLCLLDSVVEPGDRWLWNYLPATHDQVDFLYTTTTDRFQKWGKLLTYYPSYWWLALRTLLKIRKSDYDLVLAWEGKNGFPYAVLRSLFGQKKPPLVIVAFNVRGPIKNFRAFTKFGMRSVDHTVVLTPPEVEKYQKMLDLPPGAISFCPLGWYEPEPLPPRNGTKQPDKFIFTSGRSFRDYGTLARAMTGLDEVKVLVSARKFNTDGVSFPDNMQPTGWLSLEDYQRCLQESLFYIVPLQAIDHAGGDTSVMQAMGAGKAVVATRAPSTETYVEDGVTGLLVPPNNPEKMREAIFYLWQNPDKAAEMGREARRRFEKTYSFDKFAQRIHNILLKVHHDQTA